MSKLQSPEDPMQVLARVPSISRRHRIGKKPWLVIVRCTSQKKRGSFCPWFWQFYPAKCLGSPETLLVFSWVSVQTTWGFGKAVMGRKARLLSVTGKLVSTTAFCFCEHCFLHWQGLLASALQADPNWIVPVVAVLCALLSSPQVSSTPLDTKN